MISFINICIIINLPSINIYTCIIYNIICNFVARNLYFPVRYDFKTVFFLFLFFLTIFLFQSLRHISFGYYAYILLELLFLYVIFIGITVFSYITLY